MRRPLPHLLLQWFGRLFLNLALVRSGRLEAATADPERELVLRRLLAEVRDVGSRKDYLREIEADTVSLTLGVVTAQEFARWVFPEVIKVGL